MFIPHEGCTSVFPGRTTNALDCGGVQPVPAGSVQPWMAVNAAQQKILIYFKHEGFFFVITCHNAFNVWPETTLLLVWGRDAKRLDTPGWGAASTALPPPPPAF